MRGRSVVTGPSVPPSSTYDYTTPTDDTHPHAVKRATTGTQADLFTYDNAGQLQTGRDNVFRWTPFGLPFQIFNTSAQRQSRFLYDGFGQRAVENQGPIGPLSPDKRIVSLGRWFEYRTNPGAGSLSAEYVYNVFGPDGLVAQVRRTTMPQGETLSFVHPDYLGNPDAITTVSSGGKGPVTGQLFERGKYEPFGERRVPGSLAQPIAPTACRRRFKCGFHRPSARRYIQACGHGRAAI